MQVENKGISLLSCQLEGNKYAQAGSSPLIEERIILKQTWLADNRNAGNKRMHRAELTNRTM